MQKLPVGHYRDSEDYIRRNNAHHKDWIINPKLGEYLQVQFHDPVGLEPSVHPELKVSRGSGWVTEQGGQMYLIPSGRLCLDKGYVISPDNQLIWDYHRGDNQIPEEHPIFRLPGLPDISEKHGTVVSLVNHVSGAYYHWLLDVLPLIYMIRTQRIAVDRWVIAPDIRSFMFPTLDILGIPKEQIIVCHPDMHVQTDLLVIPHLTYTHRAQWMVRFLNKTFRKNRNIHSISQYQRIYISREKAHYRHVLNEGELFDKVLAPRGFQKIILEDLPMDEQVRVFSSADVIVAPHGSGLANLVFSKAGTRVIELFSTVYVRPFFVELSNVLKMKHYYLVGIRTDDSRTLSDNMYIVPDQLEQLMTKINL